MPEATEPVTPSFCLSGIFPQRPCLVPSHNPLHSIPNPHPRAMWPHQLLPGSWEARAKDRRAEQGGSRRKVPLGSFLCGPLSFLSCCHLLKVVAMWGMGTGRGKGLAAEGQKSSRSLCGPWPSSDRVLETLDLKGGVTAQRRAPVTEGFPAGSGLLIPWGALVMPQLLGPQLTHLRHIWVGYLSRTNVAPRVGNRVRSTQEGFRKVARRRFKFVRYFSHETLGGIAGPFCAPCPMPSLETGSPHLLVCQRDSY